LGIARTGGADVVQNLVGTDFGIDGFDCGGHFDGNDISGPRRHESKGKRGDGGRERDLVVSPTAESPRRAEHAGGHVPC
jgi:hypothetical protein